MHALTQTAAVPLSHNHHKSVLIVSKPWGSGLKTSFLSIVTSLTFPSYSPPPSLAQFVNHSLGNGNLDTDSGFNNALSGENKIGDISFEAADKDVNCEPQGPDWTNKINYRPQFLSPPCLSLSFGACDLSWAPIGRPRSHDPNTGP